MMNLQSMILEAANGGAVSQLAGRFGIDPAQAQGVVQALLPAIQGGFKQQAQNGGGLEALLGSVIKPEAHMAYVEDASAVTAPQTTEVGNEILGQIFGSKDVSRAVAGNAAASTGIDTSIIKQMLPVVAAMAAGAMAKSAAGSPTAGGGSANGGGLLGQVVGMLGGTQASNGGTSGGLGGLASMIDLDGDGNPLNDVMRMLGQPRR